MHEMALNVIEFVFMEKFKYAEEEAKKIIKKYPHHPAGYFFYATSLEALMNYYETTKREEEFYKFCDIAIEKAENLLAKNKDDDWALFFLGGADGIKGTYEFRNEKWITSFRHGWKGVSNLLELKKKNPQIIDVNFGIGTYDYWRSSMTKVLWWMPGMENRSTQGIEELYESAKNGIYTRISSYANLVTILNNEKRFAEALAIAEEMLEKYPKNIRFLLGKAIALYGEQKFYEAEPIFRYILSRVESESFDNHYNAILCHLWLAKIYLETKRYTLCLAECNRISYYKLDDEVKQRIEKYFAEVNKIKAKANNAIIRTQEQDVLP
jgi:tetratricopeptide (TPR) repeat protein